MTEHLQERVNRVHAWARDHMDLYRDVLTELVTRETPSDAPERMRPLIDWIVGMMRELHIRSRTFPLENGAAVLLQWVSTDDAMPQRFDVTLLGHLDTVWPVGTLATMPFRIEGDRVTGPGVFDMKGGVALAVYLARCLHTLDAWPRHRTIAFLWTPDEEIGSRYSRHVIAEVARKSRVVLCLEPAGSQGAVKVERYGVATLEIQLRGRSGHPGLRTGGVHAIERAIGLHAWLRSWHVPGDRLWLTLTRIRGGARVNQIPDTCEMTYDVRYLDTATLDRLEHWLVRLQPVGTDPEELTDTEIRVRLQRGTPPMPRTATERVFRQARMIARWLGRELEGIRVGGGSDAAHAAAAGAEVLDGLGVEGDHAHSPLEWMDLTCVPYRTALLAGLVWTA